ncbi:hypothetical protein [Psychrobacter maritimus]|uniref:hypothetical protein n=1 Tax=Psychrobacter maritimus TaxID=256325 RepID=UPI00191A67F5|nr:hypothetical protein [Psychrobacter maritimus]
MITVLEEMKETQMLSSLISENLKNIGKEKFIERVIKSLQVENNKTDREKAEIYQRIDYYLKNINELHLFRTYCDGNDIARALAFSAKLLKNVPLNERNIRSYHSDNRQYDPRKNGINIIKHGLSFDDVFSLSKGCFARLSVAVIENGEQRHAVFTKVPNEDKFIVSIVKFHSSKNNDDIKIAKITQDVMAERLGMENDWVEVDISQKDIVEIMKRAKDIVNYDDTEPMTFISSWFFDVNSFDKTVVDRIRFTGNHKVKEPKIAAREMKARALEILKNEWGIRGK